MEDKRIIFNSSLPRSGSTLLQNILAQNPRFYCSPTSPLFGLLDAARIRFGESPMVKAQDADVVTRAFRGFCRHALTGYYGEITDRPVCVDKSRVWLHHYAWIQSFYPDPKILVCVRDLRGILSSMEKLWRKARENSPSRERDGARPAGELTVAHRVSQWLNTNPVGSSILGLIDAVQRGTIRNVHLLRFEDLTGDPRSTMLRVYAYLGEPYFEHDFDHVEQVTREDDSHHDMFDHNVRRRVAPVSADHLEVLGGDLSQGIVDSNQLFYAAFYPGIR